MGAAQRGYTPVVKFLAEHGADLQATDAAGRTPLDLALAQSHTAIVERLRRGRA
jgi:ankyrin repeat protein